MRSFSRILAVLALPALAGLARAEAPAALPSSAPTAALNQKLADELAGALKTSGRLRGYAIDIEAQGGIVTLSGSVASADQRAEAVQLARQQPGVVAVRETLNDRSNRTAVALVGFQAAKAPAPPASSAGGTKAKEPTPMHAFPGGVAPYSDAPVLPPYAWPAYTPYNNFASAAYQTQYPSGAWPFIGPPYPYPMIPSGWRSVNLRWRRGYWWMKFNAH